MCIRSNGIILKHPVFNLSAAFTTDTIQNLQSVEGTQPLKEQVQTKHFF